MQDEFMSLTQTSSDDTEMTPSQVDQMEKLRRAMAEQGQKLHMFDNLKQLFEQTAENTQIVNDNEED